MEEFSRGLKLMEPEELENIGVRNRRHSNEALL